MISISSVATITSPISKGNSLTAMGLIVMAATLATLTFASCLSISEDARLAKRDVAGDKVLNSTEPTISSTNQPLDAAKNNNEKVQGSSLVAVLPLSAPIGASMESASGEKKRKDPHYLSESLSNHQYVAMYPNAKAHVEPRIWKGLGLGAGFLG